MASLALAQVPAILKSASASSKRLRLSRNKLWSSTSRIRIGCIVFSRRRLYFTGQGFTAEEWRKLDNKSRPARLRFIPQLTPERSHEGAGQIKPQPGCLRLLLERTEQPVRIGNTAAGILEPYRHALCLQF